MSFPGLQNSRKQKNINRALFSNPRKAIDSEPTLFNGVELRILHKGTLRMTQSKKIGCLSIPVTEEKLEIQKVLAQCIGVNCRTDIRATGQLIAPGNMPI